MYAGNNTWGFFFTQAVVVAAVAALPAWPSQLEPRYRGAHGGSQQARGYVGREGASERANEWAGVGM